MVMVTNDTAGKMKCPFKLSNGTPEWPATMECEGVRCMAWRFISARDAEVVGYCGLVPNPPPGVSHEVNLNQKGFPG